MTVSELLLRLDHSPFRHEFDIDVSGPMDRIFQRSPPLPGMHLPPRAREGSKVKQKMSYGGMPRRRQSEEMVATREKKAGGISRARATGGS